MYKVLIDNEILSWSNTEETALLSAILTLEANKAGTFVFSLAPNHPKYNAFVFRQSIIDVYQDADLIFEGVPVSEETNFDNVKTVTCEGELTFLNDTIQRPAKYTGQTVTSFLTALLSEHNADCDASKTFTLGTVTVNGGSALYRYTNYESTMSEIAEDLVENLGGYLRVRHSGGVRYLDYLASSPHTSSQIIKIGYNLLDLSKNYSSVDICTMLIPLGATIDGQEAVQGIDKHVDITSVNGGLDYLTSTASATYGKIWRTVVWDGINDPSTLLSTATAYLTDAQWSNMVLEARAFDLGLARSDVEQFRLLDEIRVVSAPHGLDRYFLLTKLELNLNDPAQTMITLGEETFLPISAASAKTSAEVENQNTQMQVIATQHARDLLENATGGCVYFRYDPQGVLYEIDIMNTNDPQTATKMWRWNINGWGYSDDGGQTYTIAATMDGEIDANFIKTGTLDANRIAAGSITLGKLGSDVTSEINSAVASTAVKQQYYLSTSSSSATGGSWQDTVPAWSSGKYVWTRVATTTTPVSGSASTSYSTAVYDANLTSALSTAASASSAAATAQTTANGAVASATVKTQYYLSTSSSSATGGSWSDSIPTWASGKYIWTRVVTTTTPVSGSATTTYTPSSSGAYDKNLTDALSTANTAVANTPVVNLLPQVYASAVAYGNPCTRNGLTYTVNDDGSITVTGTNSSTSNVYYYLTDTRITPNGSAVLTGVRPIKIDSTKRYRLTGCPAGGSTSTYRIEALHSNDGNSFTFDAADYGNGNTTTAGYDYLCFRLYIKSGYAFPEGGLTFYPMLTTGTTTYSYQRNATVIDGGHIVTGTLDANKVNVTNLNADNITTGALTIKNSSNVLLFEASKTSKSVTIGGFEVTSTSIRSGTYGTANSVLICIGTTSSKSIGGSPTLTGWCFTADTKFGVTKAGAVYCSDAHIQGEVTATSGSIANWAVSGNKISSNSGNTYISSDTSDYAFKATNTVIAHNGDIHTTGHLQLNGSGYIDLNNASATVKAFGTTIIEPASTAFVRFGYTGKNLIQFFNSTNSDGVYLTINGTTYRLYYQSGYIRATT